MASRRPSKPLEGNKVRLHVTVPADDFEQAIDAAFRKLAREVRIPGFRPGKAPRQLLEARSRHRDRARAGAARLAARVLRRGGRGRDDVDVIAPPEIDITAGEDDGDVEFDAVVEVRPIVTLDGLRRAAGRAAAPDVDDEAVDQQVDALRERFADLEDSEHPLIDGDYADDRHQGLRRRRVGRGPHRDRLPLRGRFRHASCPSSTSELRGTRPGDILEVQRRRCPSASASAPATKSSFQVLVKEAKQKVLPELTDEWVDRGQRVRHRRRAARRHPQRGSS